MGTDNKTQTQSQSQTRDPWYSQLGQSVGTKAGQVLNRPYESYNGQRVAPLSANENMASAGAAGFADKVNPYESRLSQGFSKGALDQYINPYVDNVLGARTRAIGEEFGRQGASLNSNAAATDAFRTGRTDLARSRLGADRIRALDEATNQTKSDAYDQAMKSYFAQGNQDVNALGATTNAEGTRIGALANTGATERSVNQANNDFNYGQFLEKRDWDVNNMNSILGAIGAINPTAGTTSTQTVKSKGGLLGEGLGLLATGVGAYMGGGGSFANMFGGKAASDNISSV
jgi:hypothetical protein